MLIPKRFFIYLLVIIFSSIGLVSYLAMQNSSEEATTQPAEVKSEKTNVHSYNGQLTVEGSEPSIPNIPGPDRFKIYEQYATSETALYIDIIAGKGNETIIGKRVAMRYQGWLTDGTLFDESQIDDSGQIQPFIFELGAGQVIPGWEQTISGMKVGGVRRLIIPSAFGYGPTGQGQIPPNALLIFDVELLEVEI